MKRYLTVLIIIILALLMQGCEEVREAAYDQLEEKVPLGAGDVVISEALTDNTGYAECNDGRYYDWIELYNASASDISLAGCYVSDDEMVPDKWSIPEINIPSGGYGLIYMSDRDCTDGEELHASFKLSAQGETVILYSPELEEIARLEIPQAEENISYGLSEDGTAWGWYAVPTPSEPNTGNFSDTVEGLNIGKVDIVINEYMTRNSKILYDADCDYSDWIELRNMTDEDILLDGYSLCDSSDLSGKWYFPQGIVIPAQGYMLVFCSGKDKVDADGICHTSFSLGAADDAIVLITPMGFANTAAPVIELDKNVSAVLTDSGEYIRCSLPTPGKENNTSSY